LTFLFVALKLGIQLFKVQDTTIQVKLEISQLLQPVLIQDLWCKTSGKQGSNKSTAKG